MAEYFLSENDVCGKALLDIVARGSALAAELQRLHTYVPKMFIEPGKKYSKILHTFVYFKDMNTLYNYIQNNSELVELNENIKNTYLPLLDRFYKLFESFYTYYEAVLDFINEIQTGAFVQFSLEVLLEIPKGKYLFCEALYLIGVMLLLLDQLIYGPVRYRIIICYYRNKGGYNINRIHEIRTVCKDTGYRVSSKRGVEYIRPENYPEEYFARFPLDKELMQMVILAIKDDDIYRQMSAYPQAKLRSFALANQGSMLFILLFFIPEVLNKAKSTMREIVDKHFYNVWMTPYYLGYLIDLTYWWKPYKAARMALGNVLDPEAIPDLFAYFNYKQHNCYNKCKEYLTEGVMSEEFVTENLGSLMSCVRDSNVSLRWLMLHRKTYNEKLKEYLAPSNEVALLNLLLICSEFENVLREIVASLLEKKYTLWNQDKDTCAEKLKELSDYYGKAITLGKIEADDSLKYWFGYMSEKVGGIGYSDSTYASRKIQTFIKALYDIEYYPNVGSNIQVRTYLQDMRTDLKHMLLLLSVKQSTLTSIYVVTDITWSWGILKDYIRLMQKEIRNDPGIALLLKNTFMKMSSILNTPMVRLIEANSLDCDSVSKYFSDYLVKIVKDVLQIIPYLVFENLGSIINIFIYKMISEPQKFDKAELVKYAQFKYRLNIAKLTNYISVFAYSILTMDNYLVGVVYINFRAVLYNGIRKYLIKLIAKILTNSLKIPCKTPYYFLAKLIKLSTKLHSFKLSLYYVQDFIHIYGLKMFHYYFYKLIHAYVDMYKLYLITKEIGYEELNYDDNIPMPKGYFDYANTFMGALLNEILNLTSPRKCTFLQAAYGFYYVYTKKEVLTLKTLHFLQKCIGISGLQGLDYLLSMKIMYYLRKIIATIVKACEYHEAKKALQIAYSCLRNIGSFSEKYDNAIGLLKKTFKAPSDVVANSLALIGQYLLLRDMICLQLRMLSKTGSPRLFLVLNNLNEALLADMRQAYNITVEYTPYRADRLYNDKVLLELCSPYFSHVGMNDPMKKIFITSKHIYSLPLFLFTTVCINISSMDYDGSLKSLMRVKKSMFEPNYFLAGSLCLLHQFHPSSKFYFFTYLANYIKSTINFIMINNYVSKNPYMVADLFTCVRFFYYCIKYSKYSYEKYKYIIDLGLLSSLDKETLKNGYNLG